MKKKILGAAFIIAIAVVATLNINLNKSKNSNGDLAMANVEALAQEQTDGKGTKETSSITCKFIVTYSEMKWVNDGVSYGGGIGANVTIPGGSALWGVNGNLSGQSSNTSGHWETTMSIKETAIKGTKIGCSGTQASHCAPYNPCD